MLYGLIDRALINWHAEVLGGGVGFFVGGGEVLDGVGR